MTEKLFAQVKRKLNITWNDDETNANVQDIIQSAIPTMLHKLWIADPDFDFSEYGDENTLFKAYCLYDFNHCTNGFGDNYSNMIAQVRQRHEVGHYLNSEGTANE